MGAMTSDVRYAWRMLTRSPGFTAVALLTLGLGIGANTAIFSVVDAVLLEPLPYPQPERLVMVWEDNRELGWSRDVTSHPTYSDWRRESRSVSGLAAWTGQSFNLVDGGAPERVRGALASSSLFPVLGVAPALGRGFLPQEEVPGRDRVVVLSHHLWQRRFGGDPALVGRTVRLDGEPYEVVGIMPPGFEHPRSAELWTPLAPTGDLAARSLHWLEVVGRLAPGATVRQAQAEIDGIIRRLEREYPDIYGPIRANVIPLSEETVGPVRPALLILFGAIGFVLLIACTNVANLLLARAVARRREITLRAALGAARTRLVRQLLTESLLLALLGGALGLALVVLGTDLLVRLAPADLPGLDRVDVDLRALGFNLAVSLVTGLAFGLAPALRSSVPDMSATLKEGGRGSVGDSSGRQVRGLLVGGQVALALVLLTGAGLMARTLWLLGAVEPGFEPAHLLTFHLGLPAHQYRETPEQRRFYDRLLARIEALPGVRSAAAVSHLPFARGFWSAELFVAGRPPAPPGERPTIKHNIVTPAYFRTMGIPLHGGRPFTAGDTADAPPVAIVSESLARLFWPGADPVGQRVGQDPEGPWMTVVGVAGDVKNMGLDAASHPEVYLPHAQRTAADMAIVARTDGDPAGLATSVQREVWALDRSLPIANLETQEQLVAGSVAGRRFQMLLLTLFAAVALGLSAMGIYAGLANAVLHRTHEIGVRVALGAHPADVMRLVVGQGMRPVLIGLALGLGGSLALTRLMDSLLFGVSAGDPLTLSGVTLLLAAVALLASWLPARRASLVDPLVALKRE